jgi:hypothetical protein
VTLGDDYHWRPTPEIGHPYVFEAEPVAIDTGLLDAHGRKIMRDPPSPRRIGFLTSVFVK